MRRKLILFYLYSARGKTSTFLKVIIHNFPIPKLIITYCAILFLSTPLTMLLQNYKNYKKSLTSYRKYKLETFNIFGWYICM